MLEGGEAAFQHTLSRVPCERPAPQSWNALCGPSRPSTDFELAPPDWSGAGTKTGAYSDQSCIIREMGQAPTALFIRQSEIRTMLDHVRGSQAEEVCGLLSGIGSDVEQVIPVENVLHSPAAYRMEEGAQVKALFSIEAAGLALVGIYHSHLSGPPRLSSQDLREAAYPEAAYLIWSPEDGNWGCRAFRLEQGGPKEIPILSAQEAAAGSGEVDIR